jgi:hypothetical protein
MNCLLAVIRQRVRVRNMTRSAGIIGAGSMKDWLSMTLLGLAALGLAAAAGCSSAGFATFTGGGLPPGDPDIGGVVLAAAATTTGATTAQAETPVEGAEVLLLRGMREVGRATTGAGGFFRFENPDTDNYTVSVTPPEGSGLQPAQRQFMHQKGQQTFLTIVLDRQ